MANQTLGKTSEFLARFGWYKTLLRLAMKSMERLSLLRIDRLVILEPKALATYQQRREDSLQRRFLPAAEMKQYQSQNPELLSDDFLALAERRGDHCYAFSDGRKLASFGWYAKKLCLVRGMECTFSDQFVFMYRGYTAPDYRGRRLHALGLAEALERLARSGKKGLISTVNISNAASRRSIERLGFEYRGYILNFGRGRWALSFVSPAARHYGVRLRASANE